MRQLIALKSLIIISSLLTTATALADSIVAAPKTTTAIAAPKAPVASVTPVATTPAPAALTDAQKAQIDQEIHTYLLAHPEILIEMSQKLQAQQQQAMTEKATAVISSQVKLLAHDPQSPVAGNVNGTITVIEFFDYQCPHCKAMVGAMDSLMLVNKNVRVVYKELPIFGPESEFASKAALAAAKQSKYQSFHHALMKTQGRLTDQQVLDIAKGVGIDINKMQAVMNTPEIAAELKANGQLAQQLGLPGTPAFIILTETAGKVTSRFIPGQTDLTALQQAVSQVSAPNAK